MKRSLHAVAVAAAALTLPSLAVAESPAAGSSAAASSRVAIDPVTKRVRPVEMEEGAALSRSSEQRARAQSQAPQGARQFRAPGGAVGVMLDDSTHSFSTATRNADGQLKVGCEATATQSATPTATNTR